MHYLKKKLVYKHNDECFLISNADILNKFESNLILLF